VDKRTMLNRVRNGFTAFSPFLTDLAFFRRPLKKESPRFALLGSDTGESLS